MRLAKAAKTCDRPQQELLYKQAVHPVPALGCFYTSSWIWHEGEGHTAPVVPPLLGCK